MYEITQHCLIIAKSEIRSMIQKSVAANAAMIYVTHRADELPKSITHVLRLQKKT